MALESSAEVLRANNWHNVILTYDTSTGINLFLDGIAVASNNDTIDITPTGLLQNIVIGSNITANFDEVKMYDKTLNEDEIQHLAFDGNYSKNIANTLYDLKFNELSHVPTEVVDDKTKALYSATNAVYDDGFVSGSRSIRMENGGYVTLAESNELNTYNGVSISAWINLDALTNTNQSILKKDGVIDFAVNTNSLALTLGETLMTFVDIIPSPPMLNDEKFHFNDPTTTSFGGARLETIVNPSFYSNKLTLSTWVKNDPAITTQQNIVSIGDRLHIGLNANKSIGCQVDTINSTTSVVYDLSSFVIQNANYSGDIFSGIAVSQNTLAFDVAAPNANTKFKLKRMSFLSPFRNSTPKTLNIIGVNGAIETHLLSNYNITYKNQNFVYDITIDDTSAVVINQKIKITFAGSGLIKIKDVDIEGEVDEAVGVSITSDAANITISGLASRQGTINVYSDNVNRSPSTLLGSGTVNASNLTFSFTFTETRGDGMQSYFVSLIDSDGNSLDFSGMGLTAEIVLVQDYETLNFTTEGSGTFNITGNNTNLVTIYKDSGEVKWNSGTLETTGFYPPVTLEFDKTAGKTSGLAQHAMISLSSDNNDQSGGFSQFEWAAYYYHNATISIYHNGSPLNSNTGNLSWLDEDKKYIVYGTDGTIKHYSGSTLMYQTAAGVAGSGRRYLRTSTQDMNSGDGAFSNIRVRKQLWNGSSYVNPILAFHHGNFDSKYGDLNVNNAALAGRIFADTPGGEYLWGTLAVVSYTAATSTTYNWTPPSAMTADVLMVAGGGGGGGHAGGGGGAGGLIMNRSVALSGQKTIIIGNGGRGGRGYQSVTLEKGINGYNTSFTELDTTIGGGGGGSESNQNGSSGGSGGGGGRFTTGEAGTGTNNQGNAGGQAGNVVSGGGGGAGSVGADASSNPSRGGNGGSGLNFTSDFTSIYGDLGHFASGGGGNGWGDTVNYGTAPVGGGSDGKMYDVKADDAQKHTGGGGGGGTGYNNSIQFGGNGGSGIVLINPVASGYRTSPRFTSATTVGNYASYGWKTGDGWAVTTDATYGDAYAGWLAFDKIQVRNPESVWHSASIPAWIAIQYPEPTVVKRYRIRNRGITNYLWFPTGWKFQGSDDGTEWIDVGNAQQKNTWGVEMIEFDVSVNVVAYRHYRLYITSSGGRTNTDTNGANTYAVISEWELDSVV